MRGTLTNRRSRLLPSRWLRISLRTALLLLTLFSLWLGWTVNRAHQQRIALEFLQETEGSVRFDWEYDSEERFHFDRSQFVPQPPGPAWLRQRIGDEYFQQVWDIGINGGKGTVADLSPLHGLPHVRSLSISKLQAPDDELSFLASMPRLRSVIIFDSPLTGTGLKSLSGAKMNSLVFVKVPLSDAGTAAIAHLENLEYANLGGTEITDAGLVHLAGWQNLQTLWLNDTKITDAGLIHLAGLKSLECLYLQDTQVTGVGLRHLNGLPNLRELHLDGCPVTPAGIAALRALPSLVHLHLDSCSISPAELATLVQLRSLQTLDLDGCPIDDDDLATLPALPRLRTLGLCQTQVTGCGLTHLHRFPSLRRLYMFSVPLSDEGIEHVARLQLDELYLDEDSYKKVMAKQHLLLSANEEMTR